MVLEFDYFIRWFKRGGLGSLAAALESAKNAKAEAQKALQEIDAMKKIAAGKAFYMQSKHVKVNYLLLTRIRSSPGAFADLPRSVLDAAMFYQAEEGSSTEKFFWAQYTGTEHPVPMCNTPDVTFPICTPTLVVSGVKLFYFLGFGSLSPCVVFRLLFAYFDESMASKIVYKP